MRIYTLLMLFLLVFAQPANAQANATEPCSSAQITELVNHMSTVSEAIDAALADDSIEAMDAFQQTYWQELAPGFPACGLSTVVSYAFGRLVDEALITRLYEELGDDERAEAHGEMVDTAMSAFMDLEIPSTTPTPTPASDAIHLGPLVTAAALNQNGCAVQPAVTFESPIDIIYVVAEDSDVPAGTSVFVRWYLDGEAYEDSSEITADRDYTDICVNFVLETDAVKELRPGNYRAEFIVNGNPAGFVEFRIE